jgi:hypothetical protein
MLTMLSSQALCLYGRDGIFSSNGWLKTVNYSFSIYTVYYLAHYEGISVRIKYEYEYG